MIFPIQSPLTERDDKAATVIIAVVYGAPITPESVRARSYISSNSRLFPLSFSLIFSSRVAFLFFLRFDFFAELENIFAASQIAPEATFL